SEAEVQHGLPQRSGHGQLLNLRTRADDAPALPTLLSGPRAATPTRRAAPVGVHPSRTTPAKRPRLVPSALERRWEKKRSSVKVHASRCPTRSTPAARRRPSTPRGRSRAGVPGAGVDAGPGPAASAASRVAAGRSEHAPQIAGPPPARGSRAPRGRARAAALATPPAPSPARPAWAVARTPRAASAR